MTTPSDPLEGPLLTGDTPMSLTWLNSVAEEERRLIFQRCRLIFGIGFVVSALLIGISRMFIHGAVLEPYERIEAFMDGALIVTFAIALLSIHVGHPSARRLMRTAFTVTAVTIILVVLSMAPIQSDFSMELVLALVLFIPAAVIPWQVPYQVVLGALAALGPAIVRGWSYVLLPEARVFWHEALGGSAAFWSDLAVTTVGLMLLAATSIVVTYTLYRLRRKASKLQRLGSYVVEREIGKGGMGRIYVARHTRMLRPSVVKVMHPEMGFDEQSLKRFEREVQVSSSLTHPNTIRIYDYGRAGDGTFYYAMEFLDGLDLKKLVDRFGPIEWPRVVFVLTQICGSLGEAHDRGFIHRDLKPANVFLTQRGGL